MLPDNEIQALREIHQNLQAAADKLAALLTPVDDKPGGATDANQDVLPPGVEEQPFVDYDTWYRFDPLVIPGKGQLVELQGTMWCDSWTRNNLAYWVVLDYRRFRGVVRCPYQFARSHWLQRDAGASPMQSVTCLWFSMIPGPGTLRWRFTDQLPPAGVSTPEALAQTREAVYPADIAVDRSGVPRSLIRVDESLIKEV